jgi:hypothetical protein
VVSKTTIPQGIESSNLSASAASKRSERTRRGGRFERLRNSCGTRIPEPRSAALNESASLVPATESLKIELYKSKQAARRAACFTSLSHLNYQCIVLLHQLRIAGSGL